MKTITRFIKNNDMFGHPFTLGFNNKGNIQTTIPGGIVSIILNIVMFLFIILKFKAVVLNEDDNLNTSESRLGNGENIGIINLKDSHYVPYYLFDRKGVRLDL